MKFGCMGRLSSAEQAASARERLRPGKHDTWTRARPQQKALAAWSRSSAARRTEAESRITTRRAGITHPYSAGDPMSPTLDRVPTTPQASLIAELNLLLDQSLWANRRWVEFVHAQPD